MNKSIAWLQLLHLADSALPIGAAAHSFGIESLIAESGLTASGLKDFFGEWLNGSGRTEAAFCLWASNVRGEAEWTRLNAQLSSFKPARESREASLRLGKRFLSLASNVSGRAIPGFAGEAHLATAFGYTGAALELEAGLVALSYLHQTLFGAISACQRLLPLGQSAAMHLLWELKPLISETVEAQRARLRAAREERNSLALSAERLTPCPSCACSSKDAKNACIEDLWNVQPMLDIASMRHPQLTTRLFIS